ncbi:MAG: MBL fold metallo-hydrolase [Marinilabiliales bacterium]|nr:MBL fold metallo-hydrolase [Marinilabiliales bacterium]
MKQRIILIAWMLLLPWLPGKSQSVYKNSDLEITRLSNGLWVIETTDKTTMYLVEGNQKALLIDTGTKCEKLNEVIRRITNKPLQVVITHMHPDHAGNMNQFPEIWYHPADTVLLKLMKPYPGKVHFVKEGDRFDLGGRVLEVSHMPAHTPGSIVILDRKEGLCFSGDAFGSGQVWLQLEPYAPIRTYIASLKKMENLMDHGIHAIYCGHYPYVKKAYDKEYILAMLRVATALEQGQTTDALPYEIKVPIGARHPMILTKGSASIVYDPDHLK